MSCCTVDGCDRTHHARGYCYMHYKRSLRHGDPLAYYPTRTHAELFWQKVDTTAGEDACWPWVGTKNPRGYGIFFPGSRKDRVRSFAHRWALSAHLGRPIADGLRVLHSCDNPPCCNPAHLREGTAKENSGDAVARGRLARPVRRLTEEAVVAIRTLRSTGATYAVLARQFEVTPETIRSVTLGRSWVRAGGPVGPLKRGRQ